jgi:PAS domain S-box-containing protein
MNSVSPGHLSSLTLQPAGRTASATDMRALIGEKNWADTPLGARETWSSALELSVAVILSCGFPMALRWGPELVTIYNDAYREILGDKHPEALGCPLREVWPEIYDELGPLNEAILRGRRKTFFAEDHPWKIRRHGFLVQAHFTISYSPVPDPSAANGIGGILITALETTERVHNDQRLGNLSRNLALEIEQRTRERDRIWSVSEDLLGVANFDGHFLSVNPAWTALLGWSEDQITSMHADELRHPDDAAAADAARDSLARGVHPIRIENRFRHKDGSWRWIAWTLTAQDGLIYVAGRHVTAEKEAAEALRASERQFRLLVNGVTDYALYMLSPDGIVTNWNAGAQRIKGYTADEMIGRHFSRFFADSERQAGTPARSLRIAAEQGRYEAEGWRVRKDGTRFWANVVIDAIRNEHGHLVGFAKITRDITERREGQIALQATEAQLAQSQKMEALGQLTGGVAHDFNNLLMVVSGNILTIKKAAADNPKILRAAEAIGLAGKRGESLTRQLLTFSRRQSLNPVVVSLHDAIEAIRTLLASSIGTLVQLDARIPSDVWAVEVDPNELELAVVNLVLNSRDAMSQGGVITITAENRGLKRNDSAAAMEREGEFVALKVSDTGCGIPEDILSKVFDPFFTTKQTGKGTGLGLSQAYGFANRSGGFIDLVSEVGRGTDVTLYLPRVHSERQHPSAKDEQIEYVTEGTALLVEDNPEVLGVSKMLLEQLGYRVTAVTGPEAALEAIETGSFDLVLSDIVMAGSMNGLELARAIREHHPDVPVILATGYSKAAEEAAAEFIVLRKPYDLTVLSRASAKLRAPRSDASPRATEK